jgi:uncharacterized protein
MFAAQILFQICLLIVLTPAFFSFENIDVPKYATVPADISGINDLDDKGMNRLMIAAMTGQLEPLRNYIAGGADVNMEKADDKNTALMLAIKGGFYYTSHELIKAKSKLEHRNKFGMTPLLLAISSGHTDIAVSILDNGGDPNIALPDGSTALIVAAQTGNLHLVQTLLNRGALLNTRSNAGETALMFACAAGHAPVVEFFLAQNAEMLPPNNKGYTPLIFAATRGHGAVIEALLRKDASSIDLRDYLGRTALDHAVGGSKQLAIDTLVALGAALPRSGYRVSTEVLERRALYLKQKEQPFLLTPRPDAGAGAGAGPPGTESTAGSSIKQDL